MMRALVIVAGCVTAACSSNPLPPPLGDYDGSFDAHVVAALDASDAAASDAGVQTTFDAGTSQWGSDQCPPVQPDGAASGYATGNQLGSIVVRDCDGNAITLDAFCGAAALWIFAADGWCPHCQAVTSNAEALAAGYAGKDLAAVNILVSNASGTLPSASDCKAWQVTYGLGTSVVALYDPTGTTIKLWDNAETALSVFVAHDRTITGKTHSDVTSDITQGIDAALAH
jgi:hypothetical protein